jgi:hypothetical protein
MKFTATVVLSIALIAPATAAIGKAAEKETDLNRVVCRTEGVTGSRLSQRKRCLTLRDWEEQRLIDRQSIDRTQANRYNGNEYNGGPGGI